jgi:hypothetical protein
MRTAMHVYPKTVTPLSARGPMCSGGITALVSKRIPRKYWDALMFAKQGRVGLAYPPFAAGRPTGADLSGEDGKACPHLECDAQYCDPYHVLLECLHARIAELRNLMAARAATIAQTILSARYTGEPDLTVALFCATPGAWESRAGRFTMFRLLTATPWSTGDVLRGIAGHTVDDETSVLWHSLPTSLAYAFDATLQKTHTLRPLANTWVQLAGRGWSELAQAWRTTLTADTSECSTDDSGMSSCGSTTTSDYTYSTGNDR